MVFVLRADCVEVAGALWSWTAKRRRPAMKTFVVAGCDVDKQARVVVCTYRADERDPRTPRYAATLGSADIRYDDEDSAPEQSASLTTCSSTSRTSCTRLQSFQIRLLLLSAITFFDQPINYLHLLNNLLDKNWYVFKLVSYGNLQKCSSLAETRFLRTTSK